MSLDQLKNVNFGQSKMNATGALGVGFTLLDISGTIASPRTTAGVYQTAPGIYAAYITFPTEFRGQVLWDTGNAFPRVEYATEQYNVEENNPIMRDINIKLNQVSGSIEVIRQMTEGRWVIQNNQMLFFDKDNVTQIATFDLFDSFGVPTEDAVFERVRV